MLSLIIIACCLLFIHVHEENVTVKGKGNQKCILTGTASLEFTLYIVSGEIDQQFASYGDLIFTKVLN